MILQTCDTAARELEVSEIAICRSMQTPTTEIITAYLKKETLLVFVLSPEFKRIE